MDRTIATGTGYIGQYPPAVQKLYESLANCPDNLLLFFHHVPYTYVLHSGKTVIQHIYDSHYEGADRARDFIAQWKTLDGHVDDRALPRHPARGCSTRPQKQSYGATRSATGFISSPAFPTKKAASAKVSLGSGLSGKSAERRDHTCVIPSGAAFSGSSLKLGWPANVFFD